MKQHIPQILFAVIGDQGNRKENAWMEQSCNHGGFQKRRAVNGDVSRNVHFLQAVTIQPAQRGILQRQGGFLQGMEANG